MADIKFSEFQKATISKDSDEIAILQDGVNKMIASPVLESKIINKTVSRVIEQGGASLNVINLKGVVPTYADLATITPTPELNDAYQVEADGLVYVYTDNGFQAEGSGFVVQPEPIGVVEQGNVNAVSGGEVYNKIEPINETLDDFLIRKNLFSKFNILDNTTVNVNANSANLMFQSGSKVGYVKILKDVFYTLQLDSKFNTTGYRIGLFPNLNITGANTYVSNRITNATFKNTNEDWFYVCFGVKYQAISEANLDNIQLEIGSTPTSIIDYNDVLIPYSKITDTPIIPTVDLERYIRNVVGKNLFDFEDLLIGWRYSASTGYEQNENGIMSNKLYLSPGINTIQGVKTFSASTIRILGFDTKDNMLFADPISIDENKVGTYNVTCDSKFINVSYTRICLQFDLNFPFDKNVAQIEEGEVATAFEMPIIKLIDNPNYGKSEKLIFASGASTTVSSNGWFERACRESGFKGINASVSGESVMQHADKAFRGTLWTNDEMENIDILSLSHNHNYDVNFRGVEYIKEDTFLGFLNVDGSLNNSNNWNTDVYLIPNNVSQLKITTIGSESSAPFIYFLDANKNIISTQSIAFTSEIKSITETVTLPVNTYYVYVKRRSFIGTWTSIFGVTLGILSETVADYENKGYDLSNNPLPLGTLDPDNPNQRLLPFGSSGASGTQIPNNELNERYAAGYDYLIKKYRQECYNLKFNPSSKWYNSEYGKPCKIIICSHWHDGYEVFNNAAKALCDRTGAIYCDTASFTGFSYKTTNPYDVDSVRWSAKVCNNSLFGGGNDLHNEPINGVIYTDMGFHPTRDVNSEFNIRRANIFKDALNNILL